MNDLYDQLMDYSDRLEASQPTFAQRIKAGISQRKANLQSEQVVKKAERAHSSAVQANEQATGLETLCTELLKG